MGSRKRSLFAWRRRGLVPAICIKICRHARAYPEPMQRARSGLDANTLIRMAPFLLDPDLSAAPA